MFNY
ncbi:hypothetical protein RDI58_001296 [Solanum bulbocastanum]